MPGDTLEILDIEDEVIQLWKPEDWIGIGMTYPESPPACVLAARFETLRLPPSMAIYTLPETLPVTQLLQTIHVSQSSSLINLKPHLAYSRQPPSVTDLSFLSTQPIPPQRWIEGLEAAFNQAWFDGAQSVIHPTIKNTRLPLAILTFWKDKAWSLSKQLAWHKSWNHLHKHESDDDESKILVREVRDMLSMFGWGVRIQAFNTSADAILLGRILNDVDEDGWLNDDIIDMKLTHLSSLARQNPRLAHVMFAPVVFEEFLCQGFVKHAYRKEDGVSLLHRYHDGVKNAGKTELWTIGNPGRNHWVVVMVDFSKRSIHYGRSAPTRLFTSTTSDVLGIRAPNLDSHTQVIPSSTPPTLVQLPRHTSPLSSTCKTGPGVSSEVLSVTPASPSNMAFRAATIIGLAASSASIQSLTTYSDFRCTPTPTGISCACNSLWILPKRTSIGYVIDYIPAFSLVFATSVV